MPRILMVALLAFGVAAGAPAQTAPPATSAPASMPAANPYSATVPVAGTSDAQRNAAIAAALTQVLQQVAPGFAAGSDVLAQAPGYVRNLRYSRAATGTGLQLQVDFDPGAITRLVAQSQGAAAGSVAGAAAGSVAGAAGPASGTSAAAPAGGQGGTGTLWVGGIDNSHAFASLLSMLRGDPVLHAVTPVGADGDGVLLSLQFDQPLATVIQGLSGPAGHLAPDPRPHAGADASARWIP